MMQFSLAIVVILSVLAPSAELKNSPHLDALSVDRLAVIELIRREREGSSFARVLWSNIPGLPTTIHLSARLATKLKTSPRNRVLAPLKRVETRWGLYRHDLTALRIHRTVRPLGSLKELDRWKNAVAAPTRLSRLTAVVELVDSPLPMVSAGAKEYLIWQTRTTAAPLQLIDLLGSKLYEQAGLIDLQKKHLRFMEKIGPSATSKWLAQVLFTKLPAHLRSQAIGILGRHPSRDARKTLTQCATANRPGLSTVCRHWLGDGRTQAP